MVGHLESYDWKSGNECVLGVYCPFSLAYATGSGPRGHLSQRRWILFLSMKLEVVIWPLHERTQVCWHVQVHVWIENERGSFLGNAGPSHVSSVPVLSSVLTLPTSF